MGQKERPYHSLGRELQAETRKKGGLWLESTSLGFPGGAVGLSNVTGTQPLPSTGSGQFRGAAQGRGGDGGPACASVTPGKPALPWAP